jgi:hypothetical protein
MLLVRNHRGVTDDRARPEFHLLISNQRHPFTGGVNAEFPIIVTVWKRLEQRVGDFPYPKQTRHTGQFITQALVSRSRPKPDAHKCREGSSQCRQIALPGQILNAIV